MTLQALIKRPSNAEAPDRALHGDQTDLKIDALYESLEAITSALDSSPGQPPTGAAGGDLSGIYPNPIVAGIMGIPFQNVSPIDKQVISFDQMNNELVFMSGVSPTGTAGGDLESNYPNPTLKIVTASTGTFPATGQIPVFSMNTKGLVLSAGSTTNGSSLTNLSANALTGVVSEANGGSGQDNSGISTGVVVKTAPGTYIGRGGTTTQVLLGGNPPTFGSVPDSALSGNVLTVAGIQSPVNKTINGSLNTVTNLPNSALVNSSLSITPGIGLTGGGSVTLGGSTAGLNVAYGTSSGTATQGNDTRLPPVPTTAGKIVYDTGSGYSETATGTSSQVLLGGAVPVFGDVPDVALSSNVLTVTGTQAPINKTINASLNTLSNIPNSALVNSAVTVTAGGGLLGGGSVSLGGGISLTPDFGAIAGKITEGNDNRLLPAPSGAGKVPYDTGSGYSETSIGTASQILIGGSTPIFGAVPVAALTAVPAGNLTGAIPIGVIPTGTTSSTVTIGNDPRLPPVPTGAGKILYDTGSGYTEASAGTSSQVLLGGTAPSFGSIPSAALTSVPASALTGTVAEVNGGFAGDISGLAAGLLTKTATNSYISRTLVAGTGTTVTNGAGTAGNPAVNTSYGTSSGTAVQGNDARVSPTPSSAGKIPYDTGTAYLATNAGTSSQVLIGGVIPAFGNVPSAALTSIPAGNLTGIVAKAQAGFGQDVSSGLTNDQVAIVSGNAISIGPLTATAVPSLDATKITTGTFGIAKIPTGTSSSTVTIGNDVRLAPAPTTVGKLVYDTGSAYAETGVGTTSQVLIGAAGSPTWGSVPSAALTSVPASALTGTVAEVNGGLGSDVSGIGLGIMTRTAASTHVVRSLAAPAAGITVTNPAGTAGNPTLVLANDLAAVEGISGTGFTTRTTTDTWTTRTLSPGTGTTVTNGDGVSGNPSINVTYGTNSSTATQGNDIRLAPTPIAGISQVVYNNGFSYAVSGTGTSHQVFHGGSTPAYAAVDLTADITGVLPIGNIPTGTSSTTVVIGNDSRLLPTPSAAGNMIYDTGTVYTTVPAGTSGQVFTSGGTFTPGWSNPITATASEIACSAFNITGTSGTFQDTGNSITLPSAGTYILYANTRTTLFVSVGAPGYIEVKFFNSTDSASVANSSRIVAYIGTTLFATITNGSIFTVVTVAALKTIKLYASRNSATTYNNSSIDGGGYTTMGYIRIG